MIEFALKEGRDEVDHLVVRRHDLSGTDYEHVANVSRPIANAIDDRGMAVTAEDATSAHGRPGLHVGERVDGVCRIEVRADLADPTTVIASSTIDAATASACMRDGAVDVRWIVPPRG